MTSKLLRGVVSLAVLVSFASWVSGAHAFCSSCGGGAVAAYQPATYTAAYQPATYTTAYAPVAYTTNYGGSSGWWPGCCLSWLWGGSSYTAAYQPTYAVSYAPACSTCSPCSSCTTNYAPCTSCVSGCSSCAPVQQVSMRPVVVTSYAPSCGCSDCGSTCSSCSGAGCSSCAGGAVTQASYEQPGCASCANGSSSGQTVIIQGGTSPSPTPSAVGTEPPPGLGTGENPPATRTFETQRPSNGSDIQPQPEAETPPMYTPPTNGTSDPLDDIMNGGDSNSTYFQAPRLFNPNDRAAQRGVAAPVRTAIYERPASYRSVSTGRISAAQAKQDAAGWTSASN